MWQDWAWTFKQWVLAVNPEIHTGLEEIEKDLTTERVEDTMTRDAVAQGKQLYSMLTTLLRECPLNLLKSVEGNNGYEAWRILSRTLAPKSKTRALALLGAIAQYPATTAQNLLEQVLKMEDLLRKYEQASGKAVPDEMKRALLLRVLPQQVKYRLTINVHEDSTYDEMREVLLRRDRSSQKWSSQIVTGGIAHNNPGPQDGPVPMEVDRAQLWQGQGARTKAGERAAKVSLEREKMVSRATRMGKCWEVRKQQLQRWMRWKKQGQTVGKRCWQEPWQDWKGLRIHWWEVAQWRLLHLRKDGPLGK